jgi:myo-inositol 2-dehydrogenase/D-chiro-inositol 1-dehydrogenase
MNPTPGAPVRVGVIGTGVMGTDHVVTLESAVSGATVAGVFDVDVDRAKAAAAGTRFASVFDDPCALITDSAVDAVLVASPDPTHEEFVLACLAAGKPVLCEKPLAPTVQGCRSVIDAEVALGHRLVTVGFMRRYDPGYVELRRLVATRELGAALALHNVHRNPACPPNQPSAMLVTGSAVHEIDLIRWLLGEEITSVAGFAPRRSGLVAGDTQDPLFLVLTTTGGTLADVEVFVNAQYGYDVRCELVAERGAVTLDAPAPTLTRQAGSAGRPIAPDWRQRFAGAYRRELQAWIDHIASSASAPGTHPRGVRLPGASAWDGYAATAVAETILMSIDTGARRGVQLIERPSLYA